jgi:hypothetical protein
MPPDLVAEDEEDEDRDLEEGGRCTSVWGYFVYFLKALPSG